MSEKGLDVVDFSVVFISIIATLAGVAIGSYVLVLQGIFILLLAWFFHSAR